MKQSDFSEKILLQVKRKKKTNFLKQIDISSID